MPGVIVCLTGESADRVRRLWEAAKAEFGAPLAPPAAIPHISLEVASTADLEKLGPSLKAIACSTAPFRVRTTGFGVFTGEPLVLYLSVVRTSRLALLQRVVHQETAGAWSGPVEHFRPDNWMPHITIAMQDLTVERLAAVMPWLARQDLSFDVPIDNLAVGEDTPDGHRILASYPLEG
jgi:2'-5' RNA ligase